MTLREQIRKLGEDRIGVAFVAAAGIPRTVGELAAQAFVYQWPESADTRAIRKAWLLLWSPGSISYEEPEVK